MLCFTCAVQWMASIAEQWTRQSELKTCVHLNEKWILRFQSMPFFQCQQATTHEWISAQRSDKRLSSVKNNEQIAGGLASNLSLILSHAHLFEMFWEFLSKLLLYASCTDMDKYEHKSCDFSQRFFFHLVLFDRFTETERYLLKGQQNVKTFVSTSYFVVVFSSILSFWFGEATRQKPTNQFSVNFSFVCETR